MIRKYLILALLIIFSSCQKSIDPNDVVLKFYGDVYEDIGYSVAQTDNGYVIAGQLTIVNRNGKVIDDNSVDSTKMGIIKTGKDGNVIWKKSFGVRTAVGSKVLVLDDGSILCTGYVTGADLQKDIFVVKLDANGTSQIQKTYSGDGNQYGIDLVKTSEGFMILGSTDAERLPVTDSTGNNKGKKDILLLRVDENLEQIKTNISGFPNNDVGIAIKPDINGGYIIAGTTDRSEHKTEQAGNNIIILKVNSSGEFVQTRIIGKADDEYAAGLEVTDDGYVVPVTIGADGTNQSGFILKIPYNIFSTPVFGPVIVPATASAGTSYTINAISKYKTNSFVLAGQTGTGTLAKMLILVVNADGTQVEGKEKITGGTGSQIAYDVISDTDDYIIAVGTNSYENNSMISLLKFRF